MTDLLYQWIDLIWIPVAMIALKRRLWIKTFVFILICVFSLRLQLELMDSIGYGERGILTFVDMPLYHRGLIVYGLSILLFLILAHFSARTMASVYIAAMLSVYITTLCISMVVMTL